MLNTTLLELLKHGCSIKFMNRLYLQGFPNDYIIAGIILDNDVVYNGQIFYFDDLGITALAAFIANYDIFYQLAYNKDLQKLEK